MKIHVPKEATDSWKRNRMSRERAQPSSRLDWLKADLILTQVEGSSLLGLTLLTVPRLNNIEDCVKSAIEGNIPGDLLEAGVWRGGACILMRAVLMSYDTDRVVWVADSFQGLPAPYTPQDEGLCLHMLPELSVSMEEVQANFERYGLLDERVRFLPGWFADTLPTAPVERLAVLRLDADMYGSTMEALDALYGKLSVGGYCIIDDYGAVAQCKQAVDDYRARHGITEPMVDVDWTCVYWRKA